MWKAIEKQKQKGDGISLVVQRQCISAYDYATQQKARKLIWKSLNVSLKNKAMKKREFNHIKDIGADSIILLLKRKCLNSKHQGT